jgi:O-antigen/teichoic acid export membrane protein
MQWRIALTWISGYFVFSFFVPVLFKFKGAVLAGQVGMTWSIINALGNLSYSWFAPKVPQYGMLVAKRNYKELDRIFLHNTKITLSLLITTSLLFWLGIYFINHAGLSVASRLLAPLPAGIFLLASVVSFLSAPFSYYMRAHKREPIVLVTLIGSLMIGALTYITGKYFTIEHVMIGYLMATTGMTSLIIVTWYRCRSKWWPSGK